MKLFSINLICILSLSTGLVFGQTKPSVKTKDNTPSKPSITKLKQRPIRTVSLGVINGTAIDLVKPDYPRLASSINVYGQVEVSVIVDETGKVTSAHVLKGHRILRASAIAAALKSTFAPTRINEELVRVNGTITYNFLPQLWNWLEIGYALGYGSFNFSYYSTRNLENEFPAGFSEVAQFLVQSRQSFDSRNKTAETVAAMIRGKLSADQKGAWLFEVGLIIAKTESICCRDDDDMRVLAQDIKLLIESKPQGISSNLIQDLQRVTFLINNLKK